MMSAKTSDQWRHANELMSFGLIAILTSAAVTLLAVARRSAAAPGETPADGGTTITAEGLGIVLGVAVFAGIVTYASQLTKERRAAKRYDCRLPCEVNLHGAVLRSRLVNVSENGAQIRTKGFRLREGDQIRIRTADVAQDATIVWADAGRAGMKFTHRLTYDAFRAILGRARERGSLSKPGAGTEKAPFPPEKGPSDLSEKTEA